MSIRGPANLISLEAQLRNFRGPGSLIGGDQNAFDGRHVHVIVQPILSVKTTAADRAVGIWLFVIVVFNGLYSREL